MMELASCVRYLFLYRVGACEKGAGRRDPEELQMAFRLSLVIGLLGLLVLLAGPKSNIFPSTA